MYESVAFPVTVTRVVGVKDIDSIRICKDLQQYLHFDFEVVTRVRELGHYLNFFKRASKPPDIRVQGDTGQPLRSDRTVFCVTCCPYKIEWPEHDTLVLQKEAEMVVKDVRALPSPNRV